MDKFPWPFDETNYLSVLPLDLQHLTRSIMMKALLSKTVETLYKHNRYYDDSSSSDSCCSSDSYCSSCNSSSDDSDSSSEVKMLNPHHTQTQTQNDELELSLPNIILR